MQASVLVVEDDAFTHRQIATLLAARGHQCYIAENVSDGIHLLGRKPSHVLLDLNLPDGMGTTILRHVRTQGLPAKVAIVTGTADHRLLAEAEALRPDTLLRKPTTEEALMAWIEAG